MSKKIAVQFNILCLLFADDCQGNFRRRRGGGGWILVPPGFDELLGLHGLQLVDKTGPEDIFCLSDRLININ